MSEKDKFIDELLEYIKKNTYLASNGDWVIYTKWLREFIIDHKTQQ